MTFGKVSYCAVVTLVASISGLTAAADPIPPGYRGQNVEVVGYVDAAGQSPFKMSLLQDGDTWYMYTSNLFHRGWGILDVTDPTDPKVVKFIEGPREHGNLAGRYRRWSDDCLAGRAFCNLGWGSRSTAGTRGGLDLES